MEFKAFETFYEPEVLLICFSFEGGTGGMEALLPVPSLPRTVGGAFETAGGRPN